MLFRINFGFIGMKVPTHISQDVLFISYNCFTISYNTVFFFEHVSLGFNIYYQDF